MARETSAPRQAERLKKFLVACVALFLLFSVHAQLQLISGRVFAQDPDGVLILDRGNDRYIALTNYSSPDAISGKRLALSVTRIGTYNYAGEPIALYRYDVPAANGAIAYQQSLTNAEHGKVYVQNAKSVLASLQDNLAGVDMHIATLTTSATNATNLSALSTLQAERSALDAKIEEQKKNIQRLEAFYNLPDSP